MTDGPCDPRHSEKTRGRYVNGVKLSPLWQAGPRCAILAAALCDHQISPRYLSHRWRAHIIYFQWFFVSQLVFETHFWALTFDDRWKKFRKSVSLAMREPKTNNKSIVWNRRRFSLVQRVVGTNILNKSPSISAWFVPRDLEIVSSLNIKRASERITIQKAAGLSAFCGKYYNDVVSRLERIV